MTTLLMLSIMSRNSAARRAKILSEKGVLKYPIRVLASLKGYLQSNNHNFK